MEEYFTMWPWTNNIIFGWKNGWKIKWMNFFKNDECQTYENSWMTHYLIHKGWKIFLLVLSWKIQHVKCWEILQITLHIFLIWIYVAFKPFRILTKSNWVAYYHVNPPIGMC
jgi:hypothetical protein